MKQKFYNPEGEEAFFKKIVKIQKVQRKFKN